MEKNTPNPIRGILIKKKRYAYHLMISVWHLGFETSPFVTYHVVKLLSEEIMIL